MPETSENEDYYGFFNISRTAAQDEISRAYRHLSRMYHPDRHNTEAEERKRHAEALFTKAKRIYEVLSSPTQRAIYDTLGSRGLTITGWELAERHHGPEEIKAEYERLERQRERELLEAATNPAGSMGITIDATDIFQSTSGSEEDNEYDEEYYDDST